MGKREDYAASLRPLLEEVPVGGGGSPAAAGRI